MKDKLNHPMIFAIVLCLFIWLCVAAWITIPRVTVAPDKQQGYNKSDAKGIETILAQAKWRDNIRDLFGREGVQ